MALTATVYHVQINLSDVDRGVYTALDLRLARHPSETMRYLLTRTLAYCFSYEEGIAFSKGGLSSTDEPPVSIRDRTGSAAGLDRCRCPVGRAAAQSDQSGTTGSFIYLCRTCPAIARDADQGDLQSRADRSLAARAGIPRRLGRLRESQYPPRAVAQRGPALCDGRWQDNRGEPGAHVLGRD